MRFAVVIEKAEGNYSAYVPDLPGCVATGSTQLLVDPRGAVEVTVPFKHRLHRGREGRVLLSPSARVLLPLTPGVVAIHTRWPNESNTSTRY